MSNRKSEQTITITMTVERGEYAETEQSNEIELQVTGNVTLDYPRSRDYPGDCDEAEIVSVFRHDEDWGNQLTDAEEREAKDKLIEQARNGSD